MSETDFAYAAALLDGEGHITIVKDSWDRGIYNPKYMLLVKITMCDPEAVRYMHSLFGGSLRPKQRAPLKNKNYRPAWTWELRGPRAAELLRKCLPYFKVKRRHAELGIALQERVAAAKHRRRAFHRHAAEEMQARDLLYQQIRELTRRRSPVGPELT